MALLFCANVEYSTAWGGPGLLSDGDLTAITTADRRATPRRLTSFGPAGRAGIECPDYRAGSQWRNASSNCRAIAQLAVASGR